MHLPRSPHDAGEDGSHAADDNELSRLALQRQHYLEHAAVVGGYKTLAEFQRALKIGPSTLRNVANGVRHAGPKLIARIEQTVPAAGSAAVLGKNFAGNSAPASTLGQKLDDIYSRQGRQLQAVHEVDARNVADVADAFNAMQEGDVFFYISALRRPLEMDVNEKRLKGAIARASARHAFLCYIRPEPGYLRELGDFTDVDAEFEAFKDRIRKVAPHADLSNVTLTTVGGCPLFAIPDFKWEVFLSTSITAPHRALAGALVAARSGTSVRVPLSLDATKTILAELESIDLPQRIRQLLRERAEGGT